MSLRGTRTEKTMLPAFAGESRARNRYSFFAAAAKKEGFVQIAAVFEETANQESQHAKRLFKLLEGGEVEITAAFPAGTIRDSLIRRRAVMSAPSEADVEAACKFLVGRNWALEIPSDVGPTVCYQASEAGVVEAQQRGLY